MKASKTGPGLLLATIVLFAMPAGAAAEYLIPPGNSAATQYTEAVPTAGGPKATNPSKPGAKKSPKRVLGAHNAAKLQARGPEGRAAAEVAAETAPGPVGASATGTSEGGAGNGSAHHRSAHSANGSSLGSAASGGAPTGGAGGKTAGSAPSNQEASAASATSSGSSGIGEVIGQATGSSDSGQLGLLLPLIVLAALAWSVAHVLRQRKRTTP
jgi:hypothetical protein